jgi:hypothetical protein
MYCGWYVYLFVSMSVILSVRAFDDAYSCLQRWG